MNQHTPQEWADITGCYVARDKNRCCFTLYESKPEPNFKEEWWCNMGEDFGDLPYGAVPEEYYTHDWTHLYEPRKADNAPNQSEVFIHGEYALVGGDSQTDLSGKVNVMMNHGWKLQGGVAVEHLPISDGYVNDRCFFYQAMVRGV